MTAVEAIDITMTIKDIAAKHPETVPVFRQFGFDTCCGGGITIHQAAARDGVTVDDVLAALSGVARIAP